MIEIFVDGRSLGTKGAGYTVLLRSGRIERKKSFKCGNFTSNQMELKAIEFGLRSIKPGYEKEKIIVRSGGKFGSLMLARRSNEWYKVVKSNPSLTNEVRRLWLGFPNIQIISDPDSPTIIKLRLDTDDIIKNS